jgi:hypothetical protein
VYLALLVSQPLAENVSGTHENGSGTTTDLSTTTNRRNLL